MWSTRSGRWRSGWLSATEQPGESFDYVELTPEYGIYEIELPHGWAGHSILERQVRTRHNINILAIRHGRNLFPMPGPEHVFTEGETLMVMGSERDIKALMR